MLFVSSGTTRFFICDARFFAIPASERRIGPAAESVSIAGALHATR
jgi:hypothetical protein